MSQTHIPVVLGTARKDNRSKGVAAAVVAILESTDGVSTELIEVKDHVAEAVTVPPWGEGGANDNPTKWKAIVEKSDAIILVIPEYNHGYPGELKLLLDSLYGEYGGKRVGIIGVSSGRFGGARAITNILPVLIKLGLVPAKDAVHVGEVADALNENGGFVDERTVDAVKQLVQELHS